MSSKEIKNLLKEAREAIKAKDSKLAVRKCNEILRSDKKNGMAYILLGAAHQETNKAEAVKYLKMALGCSEDFKLLALQGLSNCAKAEELPDILGQLLDLAPEKYSDYYVKLLNLTNQLGDHQQIINIFCQEIKSEDTDRKYLALKNLLNVFLKNRELANDKYKDELLECLEVGISDKNHMYHLDIYQNYFKLLHQKARHVDLVKAAEEMTAIYANNVIPLEWICKVYIENDGSNAFAINENLKSNFGVYVERLLELNSNSVLGLMANGFVKYAIGDFIGARDVLLRVNILQPNWSMCLKKLAATHKKLRAYLLAELTLRQLKDTSIDLAECLIEQQLNDKLNEALSICEENYKSTKDENCIVLITKAHIYLRNFESAEKSISRLQSMNIETALLQAMLHRFKHEPSAALEVLKLFESHEAFLELGRINFDLKNYDESLINILKATKMDTHNSECFYWLGKIYISINDETRSKKCFEKCLNLNPQNERAIAILSAVYRKNKEWDQNLVLLENSVKSVDGAHQKAAFFQLGLHHLAQRNYDDSITAFRSTLKYDTNNVECWEGLADAYLARGSYTSAQKVFEKSVQLNPENSYAKLQIARIKYILQQYQESIADYEKLLKQIPDYLPALKGIAESHIGRAHYLHQNHRSGRARNHCQEALHYLQCAIQLEPSFLCLWRMLANLFDFVASLPEDLANLILPGALLHENTARQLSGGDLLDLAAKCYSRCLKIHPNDDLIWFELIANYYTRAIKLSDKEKRLNILKLAFEGAKHLVKLSPARWQNWNLFGVIASSKEVDEPALAQHCFIKAVTLDKKTFTSWSNLGTFYLMQGDIKLANKAFSCAQQSDTAFLNSWIGQGTIAELIGDRDESMDLFRHCTQLGFHLESSIGYSNFVCSILDEPNYASVPKYEYAIDRMYAVPLALDNINWHCLMNSEATFEAWTYVGYLSRCQGLWNQACQAYEKAVLLADGTQKDQCLHDLGFSYLKLSKLNEAAKAFSEIKEATFSSTVGLALAFYKAGRFQDCYETYQKAIEWLASSDEEKALVLVAMAAMVYAFQGVDDSKMVLFQCIGLPSPPVEGLLSLCSISLLHNDKQLGELVIKELKKFERDLKYGHHVSFMIAQFFIQFTSKADAISYVTSRIHEYPDRPLLRKLLAELLLSTRNDDGKLMIAASRMAESSLVLRFTSKSGITSEEASKTLAIASAAMKNVDKDEAKVLAQKAIHINPMCWKILKCF